MRQSTRLRQHRRRRAGQDLGRTEAEAVGDDRHVRPSGVERRDERTRTGVEGYLVGHRAHVRLVVREQVPLIEEALATADLVAAVRRA